MCELLYSHGPDRVLFALPHGFLFACTGRIITEDIDVFLHVAHLECFEHVEEDIQRGGQQTMVYNGRVPVNQYSIAYSCRQEIITNCR